MTINDYAKLKQERYGISILLQVEQEKSTNWYTNRCGASGPGGDCARHASHSDESIPAGIHYSYDTDRLVEWQVGYEPELEVCRLLLGKVLKECSGIPLNLKESIGAILK